MTYHQSRARLVCHYCGRNTPVPERCPSCGNYLSREDAPLTQSWGFRLIALICLAVAVGWALMVL